MTEDEIGTYIVDAAIKVHRDVGPGLLESVYEVILAWELRSRGLYVCRQVPVPVRYHNFQFEEGFKADLLVENKVIVELKCVEKINNSHKKQLLTYLRLGNKNLGYLLNFSEALMKNGISRKVNCLKE